MFKCKFRCRLGAIHDRETERAVSPWLRGEKYPQDIRLCTQKGNPEVFDRQDLFRKVNADSEMTGRQ